jgi:hypothetical protein
VIATAALDQRDRARQRGAVAGAKVAGKFVDVGRRIRPGHAFVYNGCAVQARGLEPIHPHPFRDRESGGFDVALAASAFVVLDDAFGDALDMGRILVEIADQRPATDCLLHAQFLLVEQFAHWPVLEDNAGLPGLREGLAPPVPIDREGKHQV